MAPGRRPGSHAGNTTPNGPAPDRPAQA
jgi:hypothetical protein